MDWIATAVECLCALLTLSGIGYGVIALLGARSYTRAARLPSHSTFAVPVSILKPLKGRDPRMYAGFVSHCRQRYDEEFELVFGVSSLEDPAVADVQRLREEFPDVAIQLIECREKLGMSGKVSNLAQMLPHARFEHVIVNDADMLVGESYLAATMRPFHDAEVGLVTLPYVGRADRGLWARLEALGISTDFAPGVLTARWLEGGIRFGLGSTLAMTKSALASIGGFEALVDQLADDYEIGARLRANGYSVELASEVVETGLPHYTLRGFADHQLRWARSTRDSRRGGYIGLGMTYVLPWAAATILASGGALWSISLFSLALLVRVAVALVVGVGILRDGQVLRDFWLLPVRDCFGLFFWVWSYAGDTVVWRGERFRLVRGQLEPVGRPRPSS